MIFVIDALLQRECHLVSFNLKIRHGISKTPQDNQGNKKILIINTTSNDLRTVAQYCFSIIYSQTSSNFSALVHNNVTSCYKHLYDKLITTLLSIYQYFWRVVWYASRTWCRASKLQVLLTFNSVLRVFVLSLFDIYMFYPEIIRSIHTQKTTFTFTSTPEKFFIYIKVNWGQQR